MQKDKGFMPAIILTMICLVTTFLLALTNQFTFLPRLQLEAETARADQQAMFATASTFDEIDLAGREADFRGIQSAFVARDAAKATLGFVIKSSYRGYGSNVPVLVAIDNSGKILNLKILANEETPGLGKKVENKSFYSQFAGKSISKAFTVNPAETSKVKIDAVAGATISSRAVTEAINQAAAAAIKLAAEVK